VPSFWRSPAGRSVCPRQASAVHRLRRHHVRTPAVVADRAGWNPTMTMVALSQDLADRLSRDRWGV